MDYKYALKRVKELLPKSLEAETLLTMLEKAVEETEKVQDYKEIIVALYKGLQLSYEENSIVEDILIEEEGL